MGSRMMQYPVEIPYSFSFDMSIKESQLPFVRTSILTNSPVEEPIDMAPSTKSPNYRDTFYAYGDNTLLYFGDPILRTLGGDHTTRGGWIKEYWRGKYLAPQKYDNYHHVNWKKASFPYDVADINYRLGWVKVGAEYWLCVPQELGQHLTSAGAIAALPYSTLTVKRNTGLQGEVIVSGTTATVESNELIDAGKFTEVVDGMYITIVGGTDILAGQYKIISHNDDKVYLENNPGNNSIGDVIYNISDTLSVAQAVNPDYEVPSYYTFPNLTKCEYHFTDNKYSGQGSLVPMYNYKASNPINATRDIEVPKPLENINMSKMWLKLGTNRYRLRIYGKFYKWTNGQVKTVQTYPVSTYTYTPYAWQVNPEAGNFLWNASYEFSSKVESTDTVNLYQPSHNPSEVSLLVNYVNNSGQNEVRQYKL